MHCTGYLKNGKQQQQQQQMSSSSSNINCGFQLNTNELTGFYFYLSLRGIR